MYHGAVSFDSFGADSPKGRLQVVDSFGVDSKTKGLVA